MSNELPPIDGQRVLEILDDLQTFTEGPHRTQRLALSKEDALARAYLRDWMNGQGLTYAVDPVGNQFGFRKGKNDGPNVCFGSHLDTVKDAGRFDGTLGIAVAMYFIEWLNHHQITTQCPLCLVNFTNEEGVRFVPSIMGSAYVARQTPLDALLHAPALEESVTVQQALEDHELAGTFDSTTMSVKSFVELHIEQGPILESEQKQIGIVEGVQGMYWTQYLFEGQAQHTGTTPLSLRKNAGQAAIEFVHEAYQYALQYDQHLLSNGVFELTPNAPNIIAAKAKVILDSRNPDLEILQKVQGKIDQMAGEVAEAYKVTVRSKEIERYDPVAFAPEVIGAIADATKAARLSGHQMFSGAGHDAGLMGMRHPAAMIFIPSKDGISHNPQEYSTPEQVQHGLEVFIGALMRLAL